MLIALDVQYDTPQRGSAAIGLVGFDSWESAEAHVARRLVSSRVPSEYQPGAFYKRELPYLLEAVGACPSPPALIVIDGHVWLDADPHGAPRPGLGAYLYAALGSTLPVVGVAKNAFAGACSAVEVFRGDSVKPLYVTSAGYDPVEAASGVRRMLGAHRTPKLLKLADQLARGHA